MLLLWLLVTSLHLTAHLSDLCTSWALHTAWILLRNNTVAFVLIICIVFLLLICQELENTNNVNILRVFFLCFVLMFSYYLHLKCMSIECIQLIMIEWGNACWKIQDDAVLTTCILNKNIKIKTIGLKSIQ